ncbi:hypothetical protein Droror1_Dr00008708, partial [Drosera rotundifolia]
PTPGSLNQPFPAKGVPDLTKLRNAELVSLLPIAAPSHPIMPKPSKELKLQVQEETNYTAAQERALGVAGSRLGEAEEVKERAREAGGLPRGYWFVFGRWRLAASKEVLEKAYVGCVDGRVGCAYGLVWSWLCVWSCLAVRWLLLRRHQLVLFKQAGV